MDIIDIIEETDLAVLETSPSPTRTHYVHTPASTRIIQKINCELFETDRKFFLWPHSHLDDGTYLVEAPHHDPSMAKIPPIVTPHEIVAPAGSGKTALLEELKLEVLKADPNTCILDLSLNPEGLLVGTLSDADPIFSTEGGPAALAELQMFLRAISEILSKHDPEEIKRELYYSKLMTNPLATLRSVLYHRKNPTPILIIIEDIDSYPPQALETFFKYILPREAHRVSCVYTTTEEKRFKPFSLNKYENRSVPDWDSKGLYTTEFCREIIFANMPAQHPFWHGSDPEAIERRVGRIHKLSGGNPAIMVKLANYSTIPSEDEQDESTMDGVTLFKHIQSVLGELPLHLDKQKMFIYLRGLSLFDRFRESEVNHWLLNYDPEMEEAQKFPPHKHLYSHEHPYHEYFMHLKGAGLIRWNSEISRYELDHGLTHSVRGFLGITLPETLKRDNMIVSEFYSGCAEEYKRHHKYYTELRLHHLRIALGIDDEPDDNEEWLSR